MNVIPHMDYPEVEEVLKYIEKIPCAEETKDIILREVAKGNRMKHVGFADNTGAVSFRFGE